MNGAGDRLAACGIATIEQRLPGPDSGDGRVGQVLTVITDPTHHDRNHGHTIMRGLLDWFRRHEVSRVDAFAGGEGELLYREAGFTHRREAALSNSVTPSR
ncbi:hypothetical protein ABZ896_42455 [Streptomyces sp. NPDC047072]|uniref:hypothetical protein n=1 Tax=Streptomyces sp. NPDC047072 TaxID=3154809 RepID=UPI0033E095A6